MKKSGIGLMIIEKLKNRNKELEDESSTPNEDMEEEESGNDEEELAREMMDAIQSNDPAAFADALTAFINVCTGEE